MIACVACGAYSQRRVRNTKFQCMGIGNHSAGLNRQRRRLEQGLYPQVKPPYCYCQIFPASQEEWSSWINPAAVEELPGLEPGAL
eukprot:1010654-Amphidinium_carterae.1